MRMRSRNRLASGRTAALEPKSEKCTKSSQFIPLDKSAPQIRVLLLHPGNWDQQIVCEHEIVSLEKPGNYEALSYCWGPRENPQDIILNGTPFRISPSLEIALRYLRQSDEIRRLWIDALCIDQEQNEEKLHQVAQMRSVYETASQVLVWLGPPLENSDSAFDLIEAITTSGTHVASTGEVMRSALELPVDTVNAILKLLMRPYWFRMWIVQEIAVASNDPVIGCGTKWLPSRIVGDALRTLYATLWNAEIDTKRGKHSQLQVLSRGRFIIDRYTDSYNIRHEIQSKSINVPRSLQDLYSSNTRTNLLRLLAQTRDKFSTDPRDRIYALLGLIRSKVPGNLTLNYGLEPDYTKTHWRVYREATKITIEMEETLEVLHFKNHLNCAELPSWVPDFSKHWTETFPTLRQDNGRDWSASGFLRPPGDVRFRVSLDLETLYAKGSFVDSIEHVVTLDKVDDAIIDAIRDVHNAVFDSTTNNLNPAPSNSRYLVEAIWRSLVGNKSAINTLPTPTDFHNLYLNLVNEDSTRSVSQRTSQLDFRPFTDLVLLAVRMHPTSPHRRFIISKTGLLGLGTPDCQKGDSICILFGYKMPVILRPRGNYHQLLGSAYVHGIMHGEAVPSYELREELYQTFTLR